MCIEVVKLHNLARACSARPVRWHSKRAIRRGASVGALQVPLLLGTEMPWLGAVGRNAFRKKTDDYRPCLQRPSAAAARLAPRRPRPRWTRPGRGRSARPTRSSARASRRPPGSARRGRAPRALRRLRRCWAQSSARPCPLAAGWWPSTAATAPSSAVGSGRVPSCMGAEHIPRSAGR